MPMPHLLEPWRALQRRLDIAFLWPACKREAQRRGRPLDDARRAFAIHCNRDPAWYHLGWREVDRRIKQLK